MKKVIFAAIVIATTIVWGCTKESLTAGSTEQKKGGTLTSGGSLSSFIKSAARCSGANYSQSICVDTANRMIQSYLASQGYPEKDSSLRALSFDADTLRAYLENANIVTIKFMLAHQPAYINTGGYGRDAKMDPAALTLILVGLDANNNLIKNSSAGYYEHCLPCPYNCQNGSEAYLY